MKKEAKYMILFFVAMFIWFFIVGRWIYSEGYALLHSPKYDNPEDCIDKGKDFFEDCGWAWRFYKSPNVYGMEAANNGCYLLYCNDEGVVYEK